MNDNNSLANFPTEILLEIGGYLNGEDLQKLSLTSRRLFCQYNTDSIWRNKIWAERLEISPEIERIAERLQRETAEEENNILPSSSIKRQYLIARRIKKNISNNKFKSESLSFGWSGKICFNEDFLVAFVEGKILVWDISSSWSSVTETKLERPISRTSQQTEVDLAISGSILLLLFSYCQSHVETCQYLEARDINNDLNLLWHKSGLLGSHIHTIKIIKDYILIFDFLADRIEMFLISEEGMTSVAVLAPLSGVMREVSSEELSVSRDYLAVPGKSVLDNNPVVCSWTLHTGEVVTLRNQTPTCPYRLFRQTAVSGHNVYGLLDRLRLLCWDGRTGDSVFRLELSGSNAGPGDLLHTWLSLTKHFLLTVHQDLTSVSVLTHQGTLLARILPSLPPPHLLHNLMVKEVTTRGTSVFIKLGLIEDSEPREAGPSDIIVSCDMTCLLVSPSGPHTITATLTAVRSESLSGSVMFLNDTKLVDISPDPLEIHVYNYFNYCQSTS